MLDPDLDRIAEIITQDTLCANCPILYNEMTQECHVDYCEEAVVATYEEYITLRKKCPQ